METPPLRRTSDDKGASLGFEDNLWLARDVLRNNMDIILLKYMRRKVKGLRKYGLRRVSE